MIIRKVQYSFSSYAIKEIYYFKINFYIDSKIIKVINSILK